MGCHVEGEGLRKPSYAGTHQDGGDVGCTDAPVCCIRRHEGRYRARGLAGQEYESHGEGVALGREREG